VSDGLADATSPVFDRSGKYLYFLVSTDAGPVNDWFSQASADMRRVQQVYLAVLAKGVPSPLAKQSDEEGKEEKGKDEKDEKDGAAGAKAGDTKKEAKGSPAEGKEEATKKKDEKPAEVKFDPEGLSQRILAMPMKAGTTTISRARDQPLPPRGLHRPRRGRRLVPLRPREAQKGHPPREGERLRPVQGREARARAREG
jgi:hypothetical protein